jgi:hypothetical protein
MAAYTETVKPTSKGVNNTAPFVIEAVLSQALANTDTLSLTLPAGYESWVPVAWSIMSAAAPRVLQTNYGLTSHNKTTGVTIFTATGAVANGSSVQVLYVPSSL